IPFVEDIEGDETEDISLDETGETEVNDAQDVVPDEAGVNETVYEVDETSDGFVFDIPIIPTDVSETDGETEVEDGMGETDTKDIVEEEIAPVIPAPVCTETGLLDNVNLYLNSPVALSNGGKIVFTAYNETATLEYTSPNGETKTIVVGLTESSQKEITKNLPEDCLGPEGKINIKNVLVCSFDPNTEMLSVNVIYDGEQAKPVFYDGLTLVQDCLSKGEQIEFAFKGTPVAVEVQDVLCSLVQCSAEIAVYANGEMVDIPIKMNEGQMEMFSIDGSELYVVVHTIDMDNGKVLLDIMGM
ncbi:hypothetical protein JXB01_03830, partial [Candidatus Micrarchaeota archaeon]|nr:hypothetical protein [Candidatus Micrarchaeota archaeon]